MKLKPLADNVVVKALPQEEVTKSGIILPDTMDKEKSGQGEVVAVGPGKLDNKGQRIVPEVVAGNKVIFKKYAPDEVKVDGEEFMVVSADDIIAIIE
ncbi:MAG: co-chaperone GroES [Candidatus Komeilibacteria bacterium]